MARPATYEADVRAAALARERACSHELRSGNVLLVLALVAAALPFERSLAGVAWCGVGVLWFALIAAVFDYLLGERLVFLIREDPAAYAAFEGRHVFTQWELWESDLGHADLWQGRCLWPAFLGMGSLMLPEFLGITDGVILGHMVQHGPSGLLAAWAAPCWVSVAMWRRYLRHEVARVTRLDSFRLMEQEGYRWTWWWGWRL